ncbi:MAG TPA: S9 family peptidase [Steroidobacteraceae bacterium]|nr:S9 family peptidase [Steroidobacteraceae bacterium]
MTERQAQAPVGVEPPVAARRPHAVPSPFGARSDSYYWLRDDERTNPQVLAHLRAENAYRRATMAAAAGLENRLFDEIVGRLPQDDLSVPYFKHGYWYYARYEGGREQPIFARRPGSMDAAEEILIDANAPAAAHDYYQIGALEVSPDSRMLAYCEDTIGRREYRLRLKNLVTGETLPTAIENVEADLAWANDNRTLLYVAKDAETLLGIYVRKHHVGSDGRADELVFEQTDRSFYTGVSKSKSERFIFIHMESTVCSEWRYAAADDPALAFKVFLPHERDHEYQIEDSGPWFVVRSNWRATNFRLLCAPIGANSDRTGWRELVAHRQDGFIHDFDVFARFVAATVRVGGLRRILLTPLPDVALGGGAPAQNPFRERWIDGEESAFATDLGDNPTMDTALVRYTYSSPTTPTTTYDFDALTGERVLLKREPVVGDFDPARYRTELRFARAQDGAQVPVSIVHRRDTPLDGSAPLLLYAYGAYGLCLDPVFSISRLSLLDRGFVCAIAHVRGGQEMGRAWYDAGRLRHKRNSFTDFIDVTRDLTAHRYAAPDKVFAMGGSAGGLLVAAVANMAPDLYRAIVAQVPFVDVVTTMLDRSIPLTTNEYDEWGDPTGRDDYEYLLSYSPYDNVRAQDYPAMFVTAGLWDSQVQYYEPVKWVAKLRALKTDRNPLLLHVEMQAGHGGKAGRFEHYREIALEYAFMLDRLGRRA